MAGSLKKFVQHLRDAAAVGPDSRTDEAMKYAFVKVNEFTTSFSFDNTSVLGASDDKSINLRDMFQGNKSTRTLYNNIDVEMLTKNADFYVIGADLPNLNTLDVVNIGALSANDNGINPGFKKVLFENGMLGLQEHRLQVTFRETQHSVIQRVILPWIVSNSASKIDIPQKVKDNKMVKAFRPLLTGTFVFNFDICERDSDQNQSFLTAVVTGCFPTTINTMNPTNDKDGVATRTVDFACNDAKFYGYGEKFSI